MIGPSDIPDLDLELSRILIHFWINIDVFLYIFIGYYDREVIFCVSVSLEKK